MSNARMSLYLMSQFERFLYFEILEFHFSLDLDDFVVKTQSAIKTIEILPFSNQETAYETG